MKAINTAVVLTHRGWESDHGRHHGSRAKESVHGIHRGREISDGSRQGRHSHGQGIWSNHVRGSHSHKDPCHRVQGSDHDHHNGEVGVVRDGNRCTRGLNAGCQVHDYNVEQGVKNNLSALDIERDKNN